VFITVVSCAVKTERRAYDLADVLAELKARADLWPEWWYVAIGATSCSTAGRSRLSRQTDCCSRDT